MEELALNGGEPVSQHKIQIAKPNFSKEITRNISKVLNSGYLCQGTKVTRFEEEFKKKVGAKYAYAVNSGTAALHIAYMSLLEPGDEVIVPAFTFISTASMIIFSGGKPIFADIDEETLTMNPEDVLEKISSKTKALVPVHLFGNAADMKSLTELAEDHNLFLVSDVAQAHGTRINGKDLGSFDHLNCYSFYPTKMITTGEGGMVTTNNEELLKKGRLIRNHGQGSRYNHTTLGFNYRMTEIAATLGLDQLKRIDEFVAKRRRNAQILTEKIRRIPGLKSQKPQKEALHSYSYYTVIQEPELFKCTREELVEALIAENIECVIYYPTPLTKQPALREYSREPCCPVSEKMSKRVFSVPVHPELTKKELQNISEAIEKVSNYCLK